jgi:hypothetical protein
VSGKAPTRRLLCRRSTWKQADTSARYYREHEHEPEVAVDYIEADGLWHVTAAPKPPREAAHA